MKDFRTRTSGFTLVEMLVVVTLIAIVATIAISLLGGASKDAAESVNTSNIKHITNQICSYQQLHGGLLPDKLDSLLASNKVANGASYTLLTNGIYVVDNPGTVIYCGLDANMDGTIDSTSCTSKGIIPAAWSGGFASLTVSQLTSNDVQKLTELGIATVQDFTSNGSLFNGLESYSDRTLQVGDPVVAVDPNTIRNGRGAFNDLGYHDIMNTSSYVYGATYLNSSAVRGLAMYNARFLVFGIGPNSTIVGDHKGGFQEAPACAVLTKGYYNRYLLVVRVGGRNPTDQASDFAGVLDPQGNTSRSADSWASRTN